MIEQILYNRDIKDIPHYLNTTDEDILNPCLLDNIDKCIQMVFSAIQKRKQMAVCIDCD